MSACTFVSESGEAVRISHVFCIFSILFILVRFDFDYFQFLNIYELLCVYNYVIRRYSLCRAIIPYQWKILKIRNWQWLLKAIAALILKRYCLRSSNIGYGFLLQLQFVC